MKKLTWILLFIAVFVFTLGQLAEARVTKTKKHVNPVHAKRQAAYNKNKEIYRGQPLIENSEINKTEESQDEIPESTSNTKKKEDNSGAEQGGRLAELMKEFDEDGDGVISYEEMEVAKNAGKDAELKMLLYEQKAKSKKKGSSKSSKVKEDSK